MLCQICCRQTQSAVHASWYLRLLVNNDEYPMELDTSLAAVARWPAGDGPAPSLLIQHQLLRWLWMMWWTTWWWGHAFALQIETSLTAAGSSSGAAGGGPAPSLLIQQALEAIARISKGFNANLCVRVRPKIGGSFFFLVHQQGLQCRYVCPCGPQDH